MSAVDLSFARLKPFDHQVVGVEALVKLDDPPKNRVFPGCFALFDEMGAGKTKQVIDAAQALYVQDAIERVIVVAPASVRTVWFDRELGELALHLWNGLPSEVTEYHARIRTWLWDNPKNLSLRRLQWIITNYDYIRNEDHLTRLVSYCNAKTMLVLDESSAVKNHTAKQTKACLKLRAACGRVVLLNGTPIAHSPMDMFSQGRIMDQRILNCNFWQFRARYAVMGGFEHHQVIGWVNLEDLQRRFAPYVLRRLKSQCLDLPEKLPSTILTATLTESSWKLYKQMRDEMVAWLTDSTVSVAAQAIVKALRLAQITSGFIGGVEDPVPEDMEIPERPDWMPFEEPIKRPPPPEPVSEIGSEKLKTFMEWFDQRLLEDPNLKLLVWCRFRPEVERLVRQLHTKVSDVGLIWGSQKRAERENAIRLLDPRTMPAGPAVVVGTPASGSMGLNLTGAHTVVYVSNDYNLKTRLQSEDRVHRPGQRHDVSYFDIVATGPKGQRTIDHTVIKALRDRVDVATWTTAAWISALTTEE